MGYQAEHSNSTDNKAAIIKIVAATLFLGVVLATSIYLKSIKPVLDKTTLCPSTGVVRRDAILIDKSEQWGVSDIDRVRQLVLDIHRSVPAGGRLSVYTISGQAKVSTKSDIVFDMCSPGNEIECSALYENCKKLQKEYEIGFEAPFRNLLESLALPGESSYSPLLETVRVLANDAKSEPIRIHMISDFMENADRFRFYDLIPLDEEMVREYPLMTHQSVEVFGYTIQRRGHSAAMQAAVVGAWTGYFEKQGAVVFFKPIIVAD